MPFILFLRSFFSLVSLAIVAGAAYLFWTWYQGDYYRDVYGVLHEVRQNWRLWTGIALTVWSFGGGSLILKPFLARRDKQPFAPKRSNGQVIDGENGANLYVETHGSPARPCIILTHGWGLDSTIWANTLPALVDDFHVVTWDLPSMGKSKAPTSAVTLDSFAANLTRVIEHSGAKEVVLIGHSIGGMTIQTLARDNREIMKAKVRGIVLLNTTYGNPLTTMIFSGLAQALRFPIVEPQFFSTMILWPLAWLSAWKSYLDGSAHLANRLGFGPRVTDKQLEHTTLLSIRNPQGPQAKGNLAMFRWDAEGALARAGVPVLIIAGKDDIVTQPRASEHIASETPGAHLIVVDQANHMGFLERADAYNPAIVAFANQRLAGINDRGPSSVLPVREADGLRRSAEVPL